MIPLRKKTILKMVLLFGCLAVLVVSLAWGIRSWLLSEMFISRSVLGLTQREPFLFEDGQIMEDPVNTEFAIFAPQVMINAPITANVDGSREQEYAPQMLQGVAHYRHKEIGDLVIDGAFPGSEGNIFLFGHSQIPGRSLENYQGVFNKLNDFVLGDIIKIYYQGNEYSYKVTDGLVIAKEAVEYLEPTEKETLTLMSCWPLGLDLKRYLVRAERLY